MSLYYISYLSDSFSNLDLFVRAKDPDDAMRMWAEHHYDENDRQFLSWSVSDNKEDSCCEDIASCCEIPSHVRIYGAVAWKEVRKTDFVLSWALHEDKKS